MIDWFIRGGRTNPFMGLGEGYSSQSQLQKLGPNPKQYQLPSLPGSRQSQLPVIACVRHLRQQILSIQAVELDSISDNGRTCFLLPFNICYDPLYLCEVEVLGVRG